MSNGNIGYSMTAVNGRYPVDTEATFTCNDGYTRNGCDKTSCETSGSWGHSTPTCDTSNFLIYPISYPIILSIFFRNFDTYLISNKLDLLQ